MAQPDLFVVCKKCGSEVSPYITECPYCGNRLRKRAPKIERDGTLSEPRPKAERRPRAPRLGRLRAGEIPGVRGDATARPWATALLVVLSLFGYLVLAVVNEGDVAVAGPLDGEWWRVATSPFLYGNVWYELGAVTTIAIFGFLVERRHGPVAVLALFALGGAGGAALEAVVDSGFPLALGGNGAALALAAAWVVPDLLRRRRREEPEGDLVGVAVLAALMLAMPAATREASWIAGVTGLAAGLLAGLALARVRRA
ncbi:MAG TPA: rhomboid family intramembrane serine protease [Solirubrobacteraceae bacterium]|nr:rhomboid family intramembrane serine protease [Solirubrobacteraceae bacterium]